MKNCIDQLLPTNNRPLLEPKNTEKISVKKYIVNYNEFNQMSNPINLNNP